jgi:acetylornithine deacetylase/succinyl-diaminopimelate desuccinylase family protein
LLTETEKKILDHIEPDEVIVFLQTLVRSNSENPPGNEKETALMLADLLSSFGCEVQLQQVETDRPNVIGILAGEGRDKILFNGHTDTVKVGNTQDWTVDPLGGEIKDDCVYGRGACDMKAGLVSMVFAMKALKQSGVHFNKGIMFTGVIDEEVYFKGTQSLIKENLLQDCKLGFVSEPTSLKIVTRHKGGIEYIARTFGKYAHSGRAYQGENAILRMGKVLEALDSYNQALATRMDLPVLRFPTVNVGTIRGGTGVTFVPDRCQIEFDRQVLPGEQIEAVAREIEKIFMRIRQEYEIELELVKTQQFNPWEISQQDPVVTLLSRACQKILARPPAFSGLNGYCEVELLAGAGIPSVVFGPGADSVAHAPDERVAIRQVIDAARIYALLAYEFIRH